MLHFYMVNPFLDELQSGNLGNLRTIWEVQTTVVSSRNLSGLDILTYHNTRLGKVSWASTEVAICIAELTSSCLTCESGN